ncbi:MAG: hemerythrin domain-containing protein [Myxococcota bacterium]
MTAHEQKSDLIDTVHHEHDHLVKLFDDIEDTFDALAAGDMDRSRHLEVVESASGDLKVALDEMLHHFNQEEEVFFVEIEKRFPEVSDTIAELSEAHEMMCERTRWLHRQIGQSPTEIKEKADEIREVIHQMRVTLAEHTESETELFDSVLGRMSSDEREELLDEMRRI